MASTSSTDEAMSVLRCTRCHATEFGRAQDGLRCSGCGLSYSVASGIIDSMPQPSADTLDELRGMMREMKMDGDVEALKRCKVDRVSRFEDRKQIAAQRNEAFDYYGSTGINFEQVFSRLPLKGGERILEIGGEHEFPFLERFREHGCVCFETNIFFFYDEAQARADWPVRVLGDMHDLPYRDASFDVVVISAASHHSSNLDRVVSEIARVTKPGGYVMNINEPIRGLFKHALTKKKVERGKQDTSRDGLIHEHEYSIIEYMRSFRKNDLKLEASLFSGYYDRQLSSARVTGVRFAGIAKIASALWGNGLVRAIGRGPGLWIGQATIGLQMNVLLRKRG